VTVSHNLTVLSAGGDVYSCSVVAACHGTVPQCYESFCLVSVHQPYARGLAALWYVSVLYLLRWL
jgi:hypothetical protein